MDDWLQRIRTCSSDLLSELLGGLPVAAAGVLLDYLQILRDALVEELSAKFAFWIHLPFCLLGVAHPDSQRAKECAQRSVSEWDNCNTTDLVHRVAHRFLGNPALSEQLRSFASSESPLSAFPELQHLATLYAVSPLCERSIEGEHAKIEQATKHGGSMTPATVCARARGKYLIELLSDDAFRSWCVGKWNCHIFRLTVGPLGLNTRGWRRRQFLDAIYMSGTAEQHADVSSTKDALALWDKAKESQLRGLELKLPRTQELSLEWLRKRMAVGRFFGLPESLCHLGSFLQGGERHPSRFSRTHRRPAPCRMRRPGSGAHH